MFTIVASSTTMSWARPSTARISQRRSWWGLACASVICGSKVGSGGESSGFIGSITQNWRTVLRFLYTVTMTTEAGTTEKPLRKDAERNRQRVLAAARELFAERGLEVTLNDVAHHAGVGVGTVYRRFPDKELLIDTLFQEQLDEWARIYEEGLHDPDPWHAVVSTHERALELWAHNRALKEILLGSPHASERATQQRAQLHPLAAKLIERAQAAGEIRP